MDGGTGPFILLHIELFLLNLTEGPGGFPEELHGTDPLNTLTSSVYSPTGPV